MHVNAFYQKPDRDNSIIYHAERFLLYAPPQQSHPSIICIVGDSALSVEVLIVPTTIRMTGFCKVILFRCVVECVDIEYMYDIWYRGENVIIKTLCFASSSK